MVYALEDIGNAIKKERDRRGLSQRAFASLADVTQTQVSKVENGQTDPRFSTLIEIARSLDLELMLVPRRHVPAVNAIITQPIFSSAEKSVRNALSRLNKSAQQLQVRFENNKDIASLATSARVLSNFRLNAKHLKKITRATEALASVQTTPALINTLDNHASELRQIRNDLAHKASDERFETRPAYRLGEEDDDDG